MAKAVTLKNNNNEEVYPVTDISLVNGELNGARIVNASVGSDKLTPNAVWEENIKDKAVTSAKIDWTTLARAKFVRPTISNVDINYQADYTQGTWTCDEAGLYLLYFYQKIQGEYSAHDFTVKILKNGNVSSYATIPLNWAGISTMALLQLAVDDVVKFASKGGVNSVPTADGQAFIVKISN